MKTTSFKSKLSAINGRLLLYCYKAYFLVFVKRKAYKRDEPLVIRRELILVNKRYSAKQFNYTINLS